MWPLLFSSCHHLKSPKQEQQQQPKRVPDGYAQSFGSWPMAKTVCLRVFFFRLIETTKALPFIQSIKLFYLSRSSSYEGGCESVTRHAICHGCTDIIRVKYKFVGVNFCSEHTLICRKECFCCILWSFSHTFSSPQAYLG